MKKYPAYKDSGVEWIGDVPRHWEIKKLKYVSNNSPSNVDKKSIENESPVLLCNYVDVYKNDYINSKLLFMKATASDAQIDKFTLRKGDVIATKDSESPDDIAKPAYVSEDLNNVVCGYHLTLMRPKESKLLGFFLFNLVRSSKMNSHFEISARGVTRYGLSISAFNDVSIPLPPISEQIFISNYLDHRTAQIDALINNKEKLIKLLYEERIVIINQAVTKGLNPNVPMKDSGIEWLGEIPEHWEVKKLKYCFDLVGGFAFKSDDFVEEGVQLIKIGNLYQNQLQLDRQPTYLPLSFIEEYSNFLVRKGDILLSLTGTLGKRDYGYAILIDEDGSYLVNQRVAIIKAKTNMDISFSINLFHSETYLDKLLSTPTGTKQGNLSGDDVLGVHMGIPPREEQRVIADFIIEEQNRIDCIISKAQQEIELLKEYKTALISEVVTGKIDVREEVMELV